MKTTHYLRNLLTAALCLFAGVTASAQFTAKVDQVPRTDWVPVAASFSIVDVANALGTDSTTLFSALQTWMDAETAETNMFFYAPPSAPDTWTDGYTTGGEKGFWLSEAAEVVAYGDEGAFYANPVWSHEDATFSINIGMMPNALKYGIYNKALSFALKYGSSTATFAIDFTVTGGEKVNAPVESSLNVIGEKEVTVEQYPRTGYESDPFEINIADALIELGIDSVDFKNNFASLYLWGTEFNLEDVGKKDTLTNESTANAPGFWFSDIRVNGAATGECSVSSFSAGVFFIEQLAFDSGTGIFSGVLGQAPGKLSSMAGETLFVNLYIVNGDKAYRLKLNLKLLIQEQGNGLADYTKVGEATVIVEQEPTSSYETSVVRPDIEAIASALGCEPNQISMKALDDSDSFASATANNGGFWFNADGRVTAWGATAAMFVEPSNAPDGETKLPDITSFNVGQYPNVFNIGDESSAYLYFFNGAEGDKYYAYTVTLKIKEPKTVEGEFENQRTIAFTVQTTVRSDYQCDEEWSIDLSVLESIIGTSDPKLFGLATDANAEATGSIYSDKYSCDPKPGFWNDADGRVSVWSSSSPVGISYLPEGKFRFFQYPGVNNVGDVYKTTLFLVNTDNNKMITFNINVAFVESIEKAEVVGEESISIPLSAEGADITIDLSKAAEALGVTVADLTSDDNAYLRGLCDTGVYGEGKSCFDGLGFDKNGYFNIPEGVIFFNIDPETLVLNCFAEGIDVPENYLTTAKFCFQIDNKQYIFNAKFISESAYAEELAGISSVAADSRTDGQVYDLSGRQVKQPARGLYIKDGKKFIVK